MGRNWDLELVNRVRDKRHCVIREVRLVHKTLKTYW